MKRYFDLVRQILLEIEGSNQVLGVVDIDIDGYDPRLISYHISIMHGAGLIEAVDFSSISGFS
jgi:hypothetical protein